ncbi:MAG: hypothetical protein FJW22_02250 [Acidimicrobiia bacterium]|nr:hypothetical protein [Acidimicrobiia bacterium]
MATRKQIAGLAGIAVLVVAAATYTFVTPYNRIAGIRIGGTLTAPPADFTAAFKRSVGQIKTGGFPPFVVNVSLVPYKDGFITSTRPDGGYWSARARRAPNGYVRSGDSTFAMKATEVVGEAKIPYLTAMFGPDMNRRLSGGVIIGESEPVGEWQLFLWTAR